MTAHTPPVLAPDVAIEEHTIVAEPKPSLSQRIQDARATANHAMLRRPYASIAGAAAAGFLIGLILKRV